MNVIPYEFEPTKLPSIDGVPSDEEAYMVRMYFLFDGTSCYSFAHQHDLLDNYSLALECNVSLTAFSQRFLVTKWKHPKIFKEIHDYVFGSDNDS